MRSIWCAGLLIIKTVAATSDYAVGPEAARPTSIDQPNTTPSPSAGHILDAAPCALVSSLSSAQRLEAPTVVPIVSAKLAFDCLNSVPLNKTAALQLVDAIEPYSQWQSGRLSRPYFFDQFALFTHEGWFRCTDFGLNDIDLAWLKNPPKDYDFPPHDVSSALMSVRENLMNGKYPNEYTFQTDLFFVTGNAHDGHFVFYPDAMSLAFDFGRQRSLVSISDNGQNLPVIKMFEDVTRTPKMASVVTKINGIEASTFLTEYTRTTSSFQVLDAGYNALFFSKASFALDQGNGYFSGGGRGRLLYPGAQTTFTFENGTSLTVENIARVRGNFSDVNNGQDFYHRFCDPNRELPQPKVPVVQPSVPLVPGYPPAVIKTRGPEVSGYYLDGSGYEDVAVLSVLSFDTAAPPEFQKVVEKFFNYAKRDGKKKLIVDLSRNGGGLILMGYDLFRQIFPDILQDGNSRWRSNDVFNAIAEVYSTRAENIDPANASAEDIILANSVFNVKEDLDTSNLPFSSFDAKFGPNTVRDDKFTSLMRWNPDDPLLTTNTTFGLGIDVTGYGSRKNLTQLFAAEDIILLYDGFCASTCTIFSQFMRELAGVKSVSLGGRPIEGPIEGIGGVRGSQILLWNDIYEYAQIALRNATAKQADQLQRLTTLPLKRSGVAGVNVRDAISAKNIADGTPSQFIKLNSDCRLYITEHMITDVTAIWKATADSAFNGKKCAAGSLPPRPSQSDVTKLRSGFIIDETKFVDLPGELPVQNAAWQAVHRQNVID